MLEQADFQILMAMNRDRDVFTATRLHIDVVATVNSHQSPPMLLKQLDELLTGNGFQIAISINRSFSVMEIFCKSTERQPSTAS